MSAYYDESLPLIPLRGIVAFPYVILSFDVKQPIYTNAIHAASISDNRIIAACMKNPGKNDAFISRSDLNDVACICRITKIINLPEGVRVFAEGISRARLGVLDQNERLIRSSYSELVDYPAPYEQSTVYRQYITKKLKTFSYGNGKSPARTLIEAIETIPDDIRFTFSAANIVITDSADRQNFLDQDIQIERCMTLLNIMGREEEFSKLTRKIEEEVRRQIDNNQREYFLREQIKAIRKELGENEAAEADAFRERLKNKDVPDEIRERISREIERFSTLPAGSHEMPSMRAFIECMLDLPFTETSMDNLDVKNAKKILDRDHYGLEKVKDRVIEHLAVAQLTGKVNGQIICFVGPPGVGKTSISSSIAEALGRKFVRMSLGGIRDEAEIRGHRRTYIGAMPGRIIAAMRTAGTVNPVLLLDEIDKLTKDYQGDPSAAMLEVLDSAQNFAFRDHFLETPYDLSKVLFITTANSLYDIPGPLRDRMEIIEVPSYLSTEKIQIALRHLIPKQLEKHGLKKSMLHIPEKVVSGMIEEYTHEAGVRSLERCIAAVCRKAALEIANGKKGVHMTMAKLHAYLGTPQYIEDEILDEPAVGLVNGLAWTSFGGTTLQIEVEALKGSGQLQLTGKLGDVMQESAKAAVTCIRAHASELGLADDFNKYIDIHIHVPEGAVPKDGPSAGIAMFTAAASALTGIPVKAKLGMTGEITLRGRILPIGGLREKLLAAVRAGITEVLVPSLNRKDIDDIPNDVKEKLNIVFVSSTDEVLRRSLVKLPEKKSNPFDGSADNKHILIPETVSPNSPAVPV